MSATTALTEAIAKPSFWKKTDDVLKLSTVWKVFKPSNYRNLPEKMLLALKDPKTFKQWSADWADLVLAFSIWGQVITSTMNPILMYFQYKGDPKISPKERTMLLTQEAAKQAVMIVLHVGVMLAFARGFRGALQKKALQLAKDEKFLAKHPQIADLIFESPEAKTKALKQLNDKTDLTEDFSKLVDAPMGLIANLAGCFAGAVLLPIVGATLFRAIDRKLGLTGESHSQHAAKNGDTKPDKTEKPDPKNKPNAPEISNKPQASESLNPSNLNVLSIPQGHTAAYHGVSGIPMLHPGHPVHLQGSPNPKPSFAAKPPLPASSPFKQQMPMTSLR
ncbi:MAG: hypothetical protein VKJ04_00100 [Vampirovibrionales bacterium]|nr:hypothetical protein [Vampirovibrionales bacterium]